MMKKSNTKDTLADRIAAVLSVAPRSIDPEDEETAAKVTENTAENDSEDEILLSKFRKQNIDLLEDIDYRYAGKKLSRKDFESSEDEEESESSEQVKKTDSEAEETSDDEQESVVEESDFKHLRDSNASGQLQKGICIKNQLSLWETFLEMRIQLQKCLINTNQMPQYDTFVEFRESSEFMKKSNETKRVVGGVLDKLLELQNLLVRKYPETKNAFKEGKNKIKDDEEIPSDTEEELSESDTGEEIVSPKKKLKLADYESNINDRHSKYRHFRNSIIQKWNDKTRVATGKSASGHSVVDQIEHNLRDREKLVKRTQIKRSDYKILGAETEAVDPENAPRFVEESNKEIFDDDDFYHQLLRELIEVKSADLTDPVQLGRQWIQLQSLRSKMKRKIDTKATKGRKIRYAVHTKLVNFMAPIDENSYTDDAKTELFNSLFGKAQTV